MSTDELKNYRNFKHLIALKTRKIEQYRTHDVVLSGEPGHTLTIFGFPPNKPELYKLQAERSALIGKCAEIERFIRSIDDPVTREIAVLKYLEGQNEPTWRDIAQHIGGKNSESAVKMRVHRLFDEKM